MFPIFDRRGQVVAFSGRFLRGNSEKSPKYLNSRDLIQFKKGDILFAFNFAKTSIHAEKKVIICEGQMDCIAYHQCGIHYAVAPGGTALTDEQIRLVKGYAKTVYLSFDSDDAGQNATYRAILMCRAQGLDVKVIHIANGKDPAEIMKKFGAEKLTEAINIATLDNEHLLTFLAQKHSVSTPEGKTKIALEFFPYIDSLQSEIQKESNLERLSEFLTVPVDFIKRDFLNREQAVSRVRVRKSDEPTNEMSLKKNAELRIILAAITDTNNFECLHENLTENDFESLAAKKMFGILEDCFQRNCLSQQNILSACDDSEMQKVIVESLNSKEFTSNAKQIVTDGVSFIKRKSLEKQRHFLSDEMKKYNTDTSEEGQMILRELFLKKLDIDKKLNKA